MSENFHHSERTSHEEAALAAHAGSIESEIASQPDCWRRAAGLAADVAGRLPAPGERVAVAGCGTSWFIAQSYAAAREEAGQGETDAFAASEMPVGRRYDRVLVLSRSGTTTEILRLLDRLAGRVPTVAITAVPGTPVAAGRRRRDRAGLRRRGVGGADQVRHHRARAAAHPPGQDVGAGRRRRRAGACRAAAAERWRPGSSPSWAPAGPAAWPARPRSSCARRPGCGPRRTRRWSTGTARSR